jgi:hypothetical protein
MLIVWHVAISLHVAAHLLDRRSVLPKERDYAKLVSGSIEQPMRRVGELRGSNASRTS